MLYQILSYAEAKKMPGAPHYIVRPITAELKVRKYASFGLAELLLRVISIVFHLDDYQQGASSQYGNT